MVSVHGLVAISRGITADLGTSYRNDGATYHVAGMAGFGDLGSDGHNVYLAGELRKQNQIKLADRGGSFTQTDFTANGGYDRRDGRSGALKAQCCAPYGCPLATMLAPSPQPVVSFGVNRISMICHTQTLAAQEPL